MIIVEVLDEYRKCVVGIIYLGLALPFHPSCPEDQLVRDIDHFLSWDWGVSGFCELHSFFHLFKKFHHWVQDQPFLLNFLLTLLYGHG